ncbi:hypothetical protein MBLNU13_g00304t2 [Cladosporium sp. NU13]
MSTASNTHLPLLQTSTASKTPTPTVIGIYGVSGCGKSYLLEQLKAQFDEKPLIFYEGSEQLLKTFKNTLDDFKKLSTYHQNIVRAGAIETIGRECAKCRKAGIVTEHFSFCHASASTITSPGGR